MIESIRSWRYSYVRLKKGLLKGGPGSDNGRYWAWKAEIKAHRAKQEKAGRVKRKGGEYHKPKEIAQQAEKIVELVQLLRAAQIRANRMERHWSKPAWVRRVEAGYPVTRRQEGLNISKSETRSSGCP